jgi:hypothetical protein
VKSNKRVKQNSDFGEKEKKHEKNQRHHFKERIEGYPGENQSMGEDFYHQAIEILRTGYATYRIGRKKLDNENKKVKPPLPGYSLKTLIEGHSLSLLEYFYYSTMLLQANMLRN